MKDDTISRQEAIDAVNELKEDGRVYINGDFFETVLRDEVRQMIEELPSAQSERKKGRWIDMDDHVMCSCCGATHYGADKNFCPNCGAEMGVSEK